MTDQSKRQDIPDKGNNQESAGEAWYAGMNVPPEGGSKAICTLLMSYLGVGPRSKGVEYILSALEASGDNHKKASCLGEVMEYLANDPSDYYRRLQPRNIDYSSEHGFDHHADDFYDALGIDLKGQAEVIGIVLEISRGIIQAIAAAGRLTSDRSRRVFEEVLDAHSETDKTVVATAIYNFFTTPLQRPKTFGPPVA